MRYARARNVPRPTNYFAGAAIGGGADVTIFVVDALPSAPGAALQFTTVPSALRSWTTHCTCMAFDGLVAVNASSTYLLEAISVCHVTLEMRSPVFSVVMLPPGIGATAATVMPEGTSSSIDVAATFSSLWTRTL